MAANPKLAVVLNLPFVLKQKSVEAVLQTVHHCLQHTSQVMLVADERTIEGACQDQHLKGIPAYAKFDAMSSGKAPPVKLVRVFSVDTCDRWLAGFGNAIEKCPSADRFCLLPGDFSVPSKDVGELLGTACDPKYEIVIGTMQAELLSHVLSAKQLIDTYATYALMLVWFPAEARELITNGIVKPRSEFFGISKRFLQIAMENRWFPYAQTLVILLRYIWWREEQKGILPPQYGGIGNVRLSVSPEDETMRQRDLPEAITQLERIERVLRFLWREKRSCALDTREYELIDARSAAARKVAVSVFEALVGDRG